MVPCPPSTTSASAHTAPHHPPVYTPSHTTCPPTIGSDRCHRAGKKVELHSEADTEAGAELCRKLGQHAVCGKAALDVWMSGARKCEDVWGERGGALDLDSTRCAAKKRSGECEQHNGVVWTEQGSAIMWAEWGATLDQPPFSPSLPPPSLRSPDASLTSESSNRPLLTRALSHPLSPPPSPPLPPILSPFSPHAHRANP